MTVVGAGAVDSNPSGIQCGATCSATVDAGDALTLTATPAAGQSFESWGGACASSGVFVDAGYGTATQGDICSPCVGDADCHDASGHGVTLVCTSGFCQTTAQGDCQKSDCGTITKNRNSCGNAGTCSCPTKQITNNVCGA